MTDLRKAVEELMPILERWKMTYPPCTGADWDKVETLRQALAQPEQRGHCTCGEPEALGVVHFRTRPCFNYIHQPKREWVGLTDEEIDGIYKTHHDQYGKCQTGGFQYERTIEAKLKENNGG